MEQFLRQDHSAVDEAERRYGNACFKVAKQILMEDQTAKDAVREAILRAWDAIPEVQPKRLEPYLLRLTRNLAVGYAPQKGEYDRVLRELERCIPQQSQAFAGSFSARELRRSMDRFLERLEPEKRRLFVLRYWYLCSYGEISRRLGRSEDQVRKGANRLRSELRQFLSQQETGGLTPALLLRVIGNIRDRWILEAMESHRLPLWLKITAAGVAVFCIVAVGAFFLSREPSPEETQPPQTSTEAQLPSDTTAPVTEAPVETTAPATEPPQTVPSTTESPVTEPSIQDSATYQKLLTLPNAEVFLTNKNGINVLELYAAYIESQVGFLDVYSGVWNLRMYHDGGTSLTCHLPLDEENRTRSYYLSTYDYGTLLPYPTIRERYFTDIPREDVAALVYGASDPIGVEDTVKEAFIDYILYSEYFAWSVLEPEFRTEWYYEKRPSSPEAEDQTEYIHLCVKVWRPGMAEGETVNCWLAYQPEWLQVNYGTDGELLSGIIPEN